MIQNSKPLTLAEVMELSGDGEKAQKTKLFIKKFVKMDGKKAREIKQELMGLEIIKLKEEHIVKIIDFMPEDATDLIKIVAEISLDQGEVEKVLNVIKKY